MVLSQAAAGLHTTNVEARRTLLRLLFPTGPMKPLPPPTPPCPRRSSPRDPRAIRSQRALSLSASKVRDRSCKPDRAARGSSYPFFVLKNFLEELVKEGVEEE